jgi:F0F1-type ATP synthase membrane subunit b/b'
MDTIATPTTIVIDSVEYVLKSDVTSLYATMLDNQNNFYTTLIAGLAILFGLVVLFTIWWNVWGVKKQVESAVDERQKESISKIDKAIENIQNQTDKHIQSYDDKFNNLYKELDDKIKKRSSEIEEQNHVYVDTIIKQYSDSFEEFKTNVTDELTAQEADLARAFAVICDTSGDDLIAFNWWLAALEAYNEVDNQYMAGVTIDNMLISLDKINFTKINKQSPIDINKAKSRVLKSIPNNRERERSKILSKLEKMKQLMQKL